MKTSYKTQKFNKKYTLIKELKHLHCKVIKEIRECKRCNQRSHISAFEEEKWNQ